MCNRFLEKGTLHKNKLDIPERVTAYCFGKVPHKQDNK